MEFLVSWSSSTVDSCSMSTFKFVQQQQQKIKFAKVVVEKANFVMELFWEKTWNYMREGKNVMNLQVLFLTHKKSNFKRSKI